MRSTHQPHPLSLAYFLLLSFATMNSMADVTNTSKHHGASLKSDESSSPAAEARRVSTSPTQFDKSNTRFDESNPPTRVNDSNSPSMESVKAEVENTVS